jgi:hypothetical protein
MTQSNKKTIYEALGREPVHPFPARMAPGIALEVVSEFKNPMCILDPMMGSGTVLAVARSKGHRAIGVDIDPLAVLIGKVWTTAIDPDEVRDTADDVLERARITFAKLPVRRAYPHQADQETRQFVSYWFDGYARRQLASLTAAIMRVRHETIRDVLWCALSRLIISKQSGASLAMDLSHSRPHKVFEHAPAKPFRNFTSAVNRVLDACIDRDWRGRGPTTSIREGDARRLPVNDGSIDLVLTSPPYLNAIDYMRCSKFSLVWMGYSIAEIRHLRSISIGTEAAGDTAQHGPSVSLVISELDLRPRLAPRDEAILARFINDMLSVMREVTRVLTRRGKAVYVVGENTIRGTYVRNSVLVSGIAELCGLRLCERRSRCLPANRRYLPPPTVRSVAAIDARLRREVVLTFEKVVP